MAASSNRPSQRIRGVRSSDAGTGIGNGAIIFTGTGAPSNGTSGTGAGFAGPGSLYIRCSTTNSKAYINTNTLASPTWTVVGAQS